MRYRKSETKALWNLTVEGVERFGGTLEITVKNSDPRNPVKRLTLDGNSIVKAGDRITAYMPRLIQPGKGTGDLDDPQAGEMNLGKENSAEKSSSNEAAVYIEVLDVRGKVLSTDYSTTLYRLS
ncbi:MAG: hypothetical protein AABW63_00610 [Nanoarchaeota archaeon]